MSSRIPTRAVVAAMLAALVLPEPGVPALAATPAAVGPCMAGLASSSVPS